MSDYPEKIKALKTALFAIENIVINRAAGEEAESFNDYAEPFARGIGVSVELAREMMTKPLCEIFQIDITPE